MKTYIFRDIWSGKIYRVYANTAREAKLKLARVKNINPFNLAIVRPQDVRTCVS